MVAAVAGKALRSLVADGQLYLYSAKWSVDLDGERVLSVALFHAEIGSENRPRGKPMRARFLARAPDPTLRAVPADIRAVLEQACALGWDGLLADSRHGEARARMADVPVAAQDAGATSGAINVGDVA